MNSTISKWTFTPNPGLPLSQRSPDIHPPGHPPLPYDSQSSIATAAEQSKQALAGYQGQSPSLGHRLVQFGLVYQHDIGVVDV